MCVEIDLILERDVNRGVWMKGIRLIRLGEGIPLPRSLPDRRPLLGLRRRLISEIHILSDLFCVVCLTATSSGLTFIILA